MLTTASLTFLLFTTPLVASPEAAPEQTADQRIDQLDGEQGLWWWRSRPQRDDHDRDDREGGDHDYDRTDGGQSGGVGQWTGGWSAGGSCWPDTPGGDAPRGGVPEPTSALLVLGAGAGYVALRRRRKQEA